MSPLSLKAWRKYRRHPLIQGPICRKSSARPDGRWIAAVQPVSPARGRILLTDVNGRTSQELSASAGRGRLPVSWAPDSSVLIYEDSGSLYYARPEIVANVPPNCFIPRPNVGSAVICLTKHETPPVQVKDPKKMFQLIRASFNQRRKTLPNGIGNAPELPYTREQAAAALEKMGLSPAVRGEALSLSQFAKLADLLE